MTIGNNRQDYGSWLKSRLPFPIQKITVNAGMTCPNRDGTVGELNRRTFLMVEYGIESANDDTLQRINRGHTFAQTCDAIRRTHDSGILVGGHIILGLPGEPPEESLRQAPLISALPLDVLKIHQLQIIRDTPLAREYAEHPFPLYTLQQYIDLLRQYLSLLRSSLIIERVVSQTPSHLLIAPRWGVKNQEVMKQVLLKK